MEHYYHIGLPQWQHPDWYAAPAHQSALAQYSQSFNSVEGNSSFYALPGADTIMKWHQESAAGFKFCFKFPKRISHELQLSHCRSEVTEFLQRIAPLEDKLGIIWLQMHPHFSSAGLASLTAFLQQLPDGFQWGIELRHRDFFAKDNAEKQLNQLLHQQQVNRVTFDTRALFSHPADDPTSQEALRVKPRLPVHAIATANQPMLRFISPLQHSLCLPYLDQWVSKVAQWIEQGRTPYVFFHTPDNQAAPQLAQTFANRLHQQLDYCPPLGLWPTQANSSRQTSLF